MRIGVILWFKGRFSYVGGVKYKTRFSNSESCIARLIEDFGLEESKKLKNT